MASTAPSDQAVPPRRGLAARAFAIVVDAACPSQEVEALSSINADYWHPVRESLRKQYGQDVCVLGWCGAAGDFSPHPMIGRYPDHLHTPAEQRMLELRKSSRLEEIARRIVSAVDDTFEVVKNDRHSDVPLVHKTETLQLPTRLVTDEEYAKAKKLFENGMPAQMAPPRAAETRVRGRWIMAGRF